MGSIHQALLSVAPAETGGFVGPDFPAITGEWLRLEAFRETAYANGAFVTTATDQSGNGRHFSQSGVASISPKLLTGDLNGLAVYNGDHADNNGWDTGPNMSGLAEVHMFAVLIARSDPASELGHTGLYNLGSDSLSAHVPYLDGNDYDDAFSTTRKNTGNPVTNLASAYFVREIVSTATEWTRIINNAAPGSGTDHFTTATNTVAGLVVPTLLVASGATSRHKLAGFYVFSSKLTTDRTTLYSYFNDAAIYNLGV
jgi:hypothetical protein